MARSREKEEGREGGSGLCHFTEDIAAVTIKTLSSMMFVGPKSERRNGW